MQEKKFETEKYVFWFYQKDLGVGIGIAPIERPREVTDEDVKEIQNFLKDMGKWENFVQALKSLLEDLEISKKLGVESGIKKDFGFEKYEVTYWKERDHIKVAINLTSLESLRRTKGATQYARLPLEEITEQVKNIPKWQLLKRVISDFGVM